MKNSAKFFAIVGSALLLMMLGLGSWRVNANVKVLKANQQTILLWADGGLPIPPPPTGLSSATPQALRADGGLPIPPPPKNKLAKTGASSTLWADGGLPIPPPPTGLSTAFLSGNSRAI